MSNVTLAYTIQGDSDGYVIFECPFCESEFKLQAGEYQSEQNPVLDLFCPYCGLTSSKDDFYSKEVIEQIQNIAQNYMVEMINKSFGKMAKSINRSGKGIIKMEFRPLDKIHVKNIETEDAVEDEFECSCCGNHVKVLYCIGKSKIFCGYCGVDIK